MYTHKQNTVISRKFFIFLASPAGVSQVALVVKNPPASEEDARDAGPISGSGRPPWRRAWQPTPVFLPRKSHGQRILVGTIVQRITKSQA